MLSRQSRCLSFANGRLVVKPSFLFFFLSFLTWLTLVLEPQLTRKKKLDEILVFPYGRSCNYVWNQHAIHLQKEHSNSNSAFSVEKVSTFDAFSPVIFTKTLKRLFVKKDL